MNQELEKTPKARSYKTEAKQGFTLVEIIVAVAIFSIVMLISTGSLLSILDSNRKAQSIQSVMNNLNFALESMTRSMRVGSVYHCGGGILTVPNDCAASGATSMAYEKTGGDTLDPTDQVVYRLNTTEGQIEISTDGGTNFVGVTAPEVTIETLMFFVEGSLESDNKQPRVRIVVRGKAGNKDKTETEFNLQTTISQRSVDS